MRKTRVVLVSEGGDPFIALLHFYFFDKVWQDEVDKLYICYNSAIKKEIAEFVAQRVQESPKIHWIYIDHGIGSGEPLNRCLEACSEDLIMIGEEDGYIFKKGTLDKCFQKIESGEYDAGGSPRGSCGQEIWDVSCKKYGLDCKKYGDVGPNFWPNFFFCKREDLLKTDRNFGSKVFKAGEYCKELDYTFKNENCADTFVWVSMQLRAMGLRFFEVPQWKAAVTEMENKETKQGYWIEEPFGWIHAGSLSSGYNGLLSGKYIPDKLEYEGAKMEFETRVAFWTIAVNLEKYSEIADFKKEYLQGIENMVDHYQMDENRIRQKIKIYKELMNV